MLSDVPGVYLDYGGKEERLIGNTDAAAIERHAFAIGSMGPKVAAACAFARATGNSACIGALKDLPDIIAGRKGTMISGPPLAAGKVADAPLKLDWRRVKRQRVIKRAS
jgi:carbamate kinase